MVTKIITILLPIEIAAILVALANLGADVSILVSWGAVLSIPFVISVLYLISEAQKKQERKRRLRKTTRDTTRQAA